MPDIDIFCRVIDNYGDIGVCWRLARRLQHQLGRTVRLWVDHLPSFQRLEPELRTDAALQVLHGITVGRWDDATAWPAPAPCVIEAFACDLPDAVRRRITPAHQWLNLEYLSAEDWVADCHGLPSPQGAGILKRFHFPGFTPRTGGLLREDGLLTQRDHWQMQPAARQALWQALGVDRHLADQAASGQRRVALLFCYPTAPIQALWHALQGADQPWLLLRAGDSGAALEGQGNDQVAVHALPFVDHHRFDQLLWSSDLNWVRGEDSFVRAQWAGRPMVWHIYPQDDDAHAVKLEAWLRRAGLPPDLAALHLAWNGMAGSAADALLPLARASSLSAWQRWATAWSGELTTLPELGETIVARAAAGLE